MNLLKKILISIDINLINFRLFLSSHNFSKYLLYNLHILRRNIYRNLILKCVYV